MTVSESLGWLDEMVSMETGELHRRMFSDPDIFDLEMERIFARAWLFLCHETQIPKKGDFFEAPMGRDNVLVVRQPDGRMTEYCFASRDAAEAALSAPVTAPVNNALPTE